MKILLSLPKSYPNIGGMEIYMHNLAKALVRKRHFVLILAPEDTHDHTLTYLPQADGVDYQFYSQPVSGNWQIPPFKLIRDTVNLAGDFDIIHLNSLHQPLAVLIALQLPRTLTAGVVMSCYYHGGGHSPLAKLAHVPYRPIANHALRKVDAFIASTPYERTLLHRDFSSTRRKETYIIPPGIEAPTIHSSGHGSSTVRRILTIARLDEYKNIQNIIRALPHMSSSVKLQIAGDGKYRDELKKISIELGVDSRVEFLGRVSDERLAKAWEEAHVYAMMSSMESFGFTLAEALTLGIPALASDIPAHKYIRDLAQENGCHTPVALIDPCTSSEKLAHHLEVLMHDNPIGRQEFYPWGTAADKIIDAYRSTLNNKSKKVRDYNVRRQVNA